ncbi:elongator complex protein 2 [Geosmithia morbida]|uniref:Elongator complex protein 2 n=1 Tax=Geosmithia morbida TaxID=1094350 RepID=A0A9P4YRJ0_9HYPO|nr:elongator complex protein 2 [Geosmithia morbida]KAF4120517.1 elongator complex protein 2 [Geosmithia morbida]
MPVSTEYLSTGANRQTAVADWHRDGLVAFGADSNVALWEPTADPPRGVTKLLSAHTDIVRAVQFLPAADGDESTYLVTGGDDKTLVVWKAPVRSQNFTVVQTAAAGSDDAHAGAVNCLASLRLTSPAHSPRPRWLLVTGAADATIKVWEFAGDELRAVQSIQTVPKLFPLSLALSPLDRDGDVLVLAAGGTKDTIQILTAHVGADRDGHGDDRSSIRFSVQARLSGHESWIRSLSFTRESPRDPASDLLLASASQDKYIRIWRVREGAELPARAAEGADPLSGAYLPGRSPSNKAHRLRPAGRDFSVTFEALLLGHEDWIYSARWYCHDDDESITKGGGGTLRLLSTSADNSLAIWEADADSGIWVSTVRLGEISREKGATTATGSTGGFWTGLWSPDGRSVACLGRTGSWRRWRHDAAEDAWRPCVAVSGHTRAVTAVAWSAQGEYLLSTSLDQTTRLHTTWSAGAGRGTWHEMSRPQIHGYDINCIDTIGGGGGGGGSNHGASSQFVSGADEKLMRVFGEPKAVASMLERLAGVSAGTDGDVSAMPDAANMPVLGLSNKAIDAVADDDDEIEAVDDRDREAVDPASVVRRSHLDIDHPPYEETLSRHTLWPETEKLYGHGYEVSCLAASHDGRLIASACRASSANHAVIRLFETRRWTELSPPLSAHSLTATRLRFSPDDSHLLSVGRDRQWAVFSRQQRDPSAAEVDAPPSYALAQSNPKGHSRMILDAAWAPTPAGKSPLFATAGRDKQVRIWAAAAAEAGADGEEAKKLNFSQTSSISATGPVTAVDFLPWDVDGKYVLAVGSESGQVRIHTVDGDSHSVVTSLPFTDE